MSNEKRNQTPGGSGGHHNSGNSTLTMLLKKIESDLKETDQQLDQLPNGGSRNDWTWTDLRERLTRHQTTLKSLDCEGRSEVKQLRDRYSRAAERCLIKLDQKFPSSSSRSRSQHGSQRHLAHQDQSSQLKNPVAPTPVQPNRNQIDIDSDSDEISVVGQFPSGTSKTQRLTRKRPSDHMRIKQEQEQQPDSTINRRRRNKSPSLLVEVTDDRSDTEVGTNHGRSHSQTSQKSPDSNHGSNERHLAALNDQIREKQKEIFALRELEERRKQQDEQHATTERDQNLLNQVLHNNILELKNKIVELENKTLEQEALITNITTTTATAASPATPAITYISEEHPLLDDDLLPVFMSFLNPVELKICRLVCKNWSQEAGQQLRDRGFVILAKPTASGRPTNQMPDFVLTDDEESENPHPLYDASGFKIFLTGAFMNDYKTSLFFTHYKTLVTRLKLESPTFITDIPIQKIRDYLPSFLTNLVSLELQLPCELLSKPSGEDSIIYCADEVDDDDFNLLSPTRLKSLKVFCTCSICPRIPAQARHHRSHFQEGLLLRLLQNCPELQTFEFIENKSLNTNKNLLKQLVHVLNSVNLKELQRVRIDSVILQDLQITELSSESQLKSLHLNGIYWKQTETILYQHRQTLCSFTLGRIIDKTIDTKLIEDFVFKDMTEFIVHVALDVKLMNTFSTKCFPNLRKLELHNPDKEIITYIWTSLTTLEELLWEFSEETETHALLHLDSILSGSSVYDCENLLYEIIYNGFPENLDFHSSNNVGPSCSIQNMRNLQKLVIRSTNCVPYRITEVSLVFVLLRMRSLTSISINCCNLLKGSMAFIQESTSPAVYLNLATPEKNPSYIAALSLIS